MEINAFLHAASRDLTKLQAMLVQEPALLYAAGPDGETALGNALFHGHHEVAALLTRHGA